MHDFFNLFFRHYLMQRGFASAAGFRSVALLPSKEPVYMTMF
jgi:hypothetical protein